MRKILASLFVALLLAGLVGASPGCGGGGGDCESICNDQTSTCGTTNPKDCAKFCADFSKIADESGCTDKLNAAIDCEAGLSDVCKSGSCSAKINTLANCEASYCSQHQSECAALNGD